jgi:hypothetical protein
MHTHANRAEHTSLVEVLLDFGADVDMVNYQKQTPLKVICMTPRLLLCLHHRRHHCITMIMEWSIHIHTQTRTQTHTDGLQAQQRAHRDAAAGLQGAQRLAPPRVAHRVRV